MTSADPRPGAPATLPAAVGPRCVLRGGGDLATGVAWRLWRAGFPVVVTELADPLTVRRSVAVSSAVHAGHVVVEGMPARRTDDPAEAVAVAARGAIAVLVEPGLPDVGAAVVIDARLAKRNIDTTIADAPLVVGLGPGFTPGADCHAAVETARGHHLGRVLWERPPLPDTGVPGEVGGRSSERVVRAPVDGVATWIAAIGDRVVAGQRLGEVAGVAIEAPFDGVVRGLIRSGRVVAAGCKIGDVDPRADTPVHEISDKALAIGGGVLEAVTTWLHRSR